MSFQMLVASNTPLIGEDDPDIVARTFFEQIGYISKGSDPTIPYKIFADFFLKHPTKAWIVDEIASELKTSRPTIYRHLKGNIPLNTIRQILRRLTEEKKIVFPATICNDIINEKSFKQMPVATGNRTRHFLKIQDGCNAFCTYCIVPYARGCSRSMPLKNILDNIIHIKKSGYREVVLSGIHLGRYGIDLSPQTNLAELIKRIHESRAIERVRLSSIEPLELTEAIIKTVAESDIFCRHLHIPLQSGDNSILKKMRRPYTRSMFRNLLYRIYELIPDAAIGVDTIIGFPGETQQAFKNTYNLIEELPATYLHVFPFSSRKKTPAGSFPDKVPQKIIKERCKIMRDLGNIKKGEFYKKNIGEKVEVLIEEKRNITTGFLKGMTSNYLSIFLNGNDDLKNKIVSAKIEKINNDNSLFADIITSQ